jgi:hypothetical protein
MVTDLIILLESLKLWPLNYIINWYRVRKSNEVVPKHIA